MVNPLIIVPRTSDSLANPASCPFATAHTLIGHFVSNSHTSQKVSRLEKERAPVERQELDKRMRWGDALNKKKNDLNRIKYLRSFLSKEKYKALHNKDAQMYFAWRQAAARGMVIEHDGFRQVTFGDSWRQLQSIGLDIPPDLEKALREREGADQRRASGRSYRRTLGDFVDLYRSRRGPSQNS